MKVALRSKVKRKKPSKKSTEGGEYFEFEITVSKILIAFVVIFAAGYLSIYSIRNVSANGWRNPTTEVENFAASDGHLNTDPKFNEIDEFGTFIEHDNEVCTVNGKIQVFMFTESSCINSHWISDSFNSWAASRDDIEVYRYEIFTGDNEFTEEIETSIPANHRVLFDEFSPNLLVPTYLVGCVYSREENGYEEENDLEQEIAEFNKLIEELKDRI